MIRSTSAVRLLAGDKEPVRLASTANLALAGLLTVDGVVCRPGDRILVKDQTDATENGIYTASEGAWFRSPDFNRSNLIIAGMKVAIQEGAEHGGDVWNLVTDRPEIGDEAIEWAFYLSTTLASDISALVETGINSVANASAAILATAWAATNAADFASRAAAIALSVPVGLNYLRTAGYYVAGDRGGALYKKVGSAPSHSGKFQSADGAWWEIAEDVLNPYQFGAYGNGGDDTAALQACIDTAAALTSSGGFVSLGTGAFGVSATITIPTVSGRGVSIKGDGPGRTRIIRLPSFVAGDIFYAGAIGNPPSSWLEISDFLVINASGVLNTSGYALHVDSRANARLERIMIYDGFGGVSITGGCSDIYLSHVIYFQSTTYATSIGASEAGLKVQGLVSSIFVRDCQFLGQNVATPNCVSYGVYIAGSDGIQFTGCAFSGSTGIHFAAGSGYNIDDAFFSNCVIDACRQYGVRFAGLNGASHVYTNLRFSSTHINARVDSGLDTVGIAIQGDCDFIQFVGCNINLSGAEGVAISSVTNWTGAPRQSIKFTECDISGNNANNVGAPNIRLEAGASGVAIVGCNACNRTGSAGASTYGIALQGGNSNVTIADCVLEPNVTGAIYYGTGGHSNLKIANNRGVPDQQAGIVNPQVTAAFGSLYSANSPVVFATPFQEIPDVQAQVTSAADGGISVVLDSISTTGFVYTAIGRTNNGFVPFKWVARGH